MGWFWSDSQPSSASASAPVKPSTRHTPSNEAPSQCPVAPSARSSFFSSFSTSSTSAPEPSEADPSSSSACPYQAPSVTPSTTQAPSSSRTIAALNPLNYMPSDLRQGRESASQTRALSLEREMSSIPRARQQCPPQPQSSNSALSPPVEDSEGSKWVYPSPQQMYNALVRKGYTDTPQDSMDAMVAVHNFLNEGAWAEIIEWERRFSRGLRTGWELSAHGEDGSVTGAMIAPTETADEYDEHPRLLRFMGRKDAMTPKALLWQGLGKVWPSMAMEPPFDRHDWFVERKGREVRYVIDYYSGPPEETGEPVFYLDIRPALDRPEQVAERLVRWGRDVWWRGSGGRARMANNMGMLQ